MAKRTIGGVALCLSRTLPVARPVSRKGRFSVTVSSLGQAVGAVGSCLIRLRLIADAGQPSPAWSQNPPNLEMVKRALEENSPPLYDFFSRLKAVYPAARLELIAARNIMIGKGGTVRQGLAEAFGTSGVFYLDCAYDSIKDAVNRVTDADGATDDFLLMVINSIKDQFGKADNDSLYLLELELRDATAGADDGKPKDTAGAVGGKGAGRTGVKPKKSTAKGEAQAKIIAAFTLHHKYQNGSCLNQEPIKVGELATNAEVGKASVNRFFNKQFGVGKPKKDGHKQYMIACRATDLLVMTLRMLNGEITPSLLLSGREPPTPTGGKHRRGHTPGCALRCWR